MKASCLQQNLAKAINTVSRLTGIKGALPVLGNILMATERGRLKLAATDLEVGIKFYIGAKIEGEGAITAPSRLLQEFISANTDETVDLAVDEGQSIFSLSSKHFRAKINGIDAKEFPLIPEIKPSTIVGVSANQLKVAINQVVYACAIDETRPVLTGVLVAGEENRLKLVSTDSYRLAEKQLNLKDKVERSFALILPARTLSELGRLIESSTEAATLSIGENQVQIKVGEAVIVSRIIEGQFPDYQQIIPQSSKTTCLADRLALVNAMRIAIAFSRGAANNVRLTLKEKQLLEVRASSSQVGENETSVPAEIKGEELAIDFNAKYLLDALSAIDADRVMIELNDKYSAGVLKPTKPAGYLALVMPLRLEEERG